jgi:hypothetical protein
LKAAKQLLDCYRTGEANNPETFGAAIAAVLSDYPLDVVLYVCDPRTGLPSSSTWMPNCAEVKAACNDRMAWLQKVEKFQNWGKKPLEIEPPREDRPTREDLKAKYGENWGLTSLDEPAKTAKPAPSWDQIGEYYRARPGRVQWLADRLSVLRGEAEDTPEPK